MTCRIVLSIATLLAVQACASGTEPSATCSADCTKGIVPPTSSEALAYLNAAIDIMQRHSINRSSVDWPALRAAAAANANGAQTPADTYPAIVSALAPLGDRHSSLIYPDKHSSVPAGAKPLVGSTFAAKIVAAKIAWIQVPNTFSTAGALSWQDQLARSVTDMDRANPCGWMIDLRRNPGGNMWPMLVAIGPILGEGDAGSFLTPDSTRVSWFYSAGAAGIVNQGQAIVQATVSHTYILQHPMPPVAVLLGPNTASSGEAIAIAFHGRPLTRMFGEPTYGVPTANQEYPLQDGAALNLTVAADADRKGQVFWPNPIFPDERYSESVVDPQDSRDTAAAAAVGWLLKQDACTN